MAINIIGGNPQKMQFDISGSKLQLDQIEVQGEATTAPGVWQKGDWLGEILMRKSVVRWRKPIELDLEADLHLDDTRPFVAMLANHVGRRDWLEKLLSVDNVKGTGNMTLRENRMLFPLIFVDAGEVKLGAKGLIDGARREGVIYAKYKKLNGMLRVSGKKTNFELRKARAKFDQYQPGQILFADKKIVRSNTRANKDSLLTSNAKILKPKKDQNPDRESDRTQ